jgi:hypothetical protein
MAYTSGSSSIRITNLESIVVDYTDLEGAVGYFTNSADQIEQGVLISTTANSRFNTANGNEVVSSEKCTITYTVIGNNITDLNVYEWLKNNTTKIVRLTITLDNGNVITTGSCFINSIRAAKSNDMFRVLITIEKSLDDVDDFLTWTE